MTANESAVDVEHYARGRTLLFCGVEDFGIVPVEAMAAGCRIVAFNDGGVTETVRETGEQATGVYFTETSVEALKDAIDRLESEARCKRLRADVISAQTKRFCRTRFGAEMRTLWNGGRNFVT